MYLKKIALPIFLFLLCFSILAGCNSGNSAPASVPLTKQEIQVKEEYFGDTEFSDITSEVMTAERQSKFPAVKKVYKSADDNFFIVSEPIGYHGPMTLGIAINGRDMTSVGMRIIDHMEKVEYVRDFDSDWFESRFVGKSVSENLITVYLEAKTDNEIVTVTGATVSTDGVVNGVNAAFAVVREYILGTNEDAVPLAAELDRKWDTSELLQ